VRSEEEERERLVLMSAYEKPFWEKGLFVAGMDEAGRGPLAGPCVAAAVIMPPGFLIPGVDDSKKVPEKKRRELYRLITESAVCYAVGIVSNIIIDDINILNAAKRAFEEAFAGLSEKPAHVFCDRVSNPKKNPARMEQTLRLGASYEEITDGDALCYSIAAASIIAKETRDAMMREYANVFPEYGFEKHKGYATREHMECIIKNGACEIHRRSFLKNLYGHEGNG
jgi:ribonuclease HII